MVERFVGSELQTPTCKQRIGNPRTHRDENVNMLHIVDDKGERGPGRRKQMESIAKRMVDLMYTEIAKMNGVTESEAHQLCGGCSLSIVVALIEQLLIQAHASSNEAIAYLQVLNEDVVKMFDQIQSRGRTGSINIDDILNALFSGRL